MKWFGFIATICFITITSLDSAYAMVEVEHGFIAPHVNLYSQDPDPFNGLESFMERSGVKPYELFWREDGILSTRVIFNDRVYGTEIWMLDNSPVIDNNSTASVWSAWNANGSIIMLDGARVDSEGENRGWLMNEDFSRLRRPPISGISGLSSHVWDLESPDIFFYHRAGELLECNVRTGEVRTVATWEPYPRERVYGLTEDNHYLFLDTPNGGMWVTYEPGEEPIPKLGLIDGRPEAPDENGNAPHPRNAGNTLILGLPDSLDWRDAVADTEKWGPIIKIRVGLLIDRETGIIDPVIVPVIGKDAYLRAYAEGRIHFPTGDGWEEYRIHTSDDVDELFEIYRYYPTMTHGHESPSPDKHYMAKDSTPVRLVSIRDGSTRVAQTQYMPAFHGQAGGSYIDLNTLYAPRGFASHCHWERHPRFFLSWLQGTHIVYDDVLVAAFARPARANYLFQIFTDGTIQPIIDTKQRFSGTYLGGDYSMFSRDATKVHVGSSMTGRSRTYIAVMARPRAPEQVLWQVNNSNSAIVLRWAPPAYSNEIKGYYVYRSGESGHGYQLLTAEPLQTTQWADNSVEPGIPYYYVLTSVEYSGLESAYSHEVSRAGINLPDHLNDHLTLYFEAETGIKDLYTNEQPGLAMGADRWEASDWYYVYRHPASQTGTITQTIALPEVAQPYYLWARIRSEEGALSQWNFILDGKEYEVATHSTAWSWTRATEKVRDLQAASVELTIATNAPQAQLDVLCFTTNPEFVPDGACPENATPPGSVKNLQLNTVQDRVNYLTWERPDSQNISHYQIYASRTPIVELSQELIIGSPTSEEFIDWGLLADTTYYYAVTAVDRQRNESIHSTATATTPVGEPTTHLVLTFAEAQREGNFEELTADVTLGSFYVVPEDTETNVVEWEIDVPHDGEFAIWLRYLPRGDGWRGSESHQSIDFIVNEEKMAVIDGGRTDLNSPDYLITNGHPMASRMWTWVSYGLSNLERVNLAKGSQTIRLENLNDNIRYDALVLTSEPAWKPLDGRLKQH